MRSTTAAGMLLGGTILLSGCVRFTPSVLRAPDVFLEKIVFCQSVEVRDGTAAASPAADSFHRARDESIYCYIELGELRGAHELQWRWYAPAGELMRRSDRIEVGEAGKTFARFLAWDRISVHPESEGGAWSAAVFLDGVLLASRRFEIL
jgi:hypothetical protein